MTDVIYPDISHNRILLDLCLYSKANDFISQLNPPVDKPSLRNTGFSNLTTTRQSKSVIKLLPSQGNGPEFQNQGSFKAFTL
jgi:hypothetical protein